ncbi:S8 family serine peptidase [Microbulbifer marinus]|uniref:Serine protease n=1 Tax=Microbulbifer marinus TaxID=658218 RepID=A0A1H3WRS6_9GAMM|nr:S8 family serine peptidase [Microbulbifer marinus]SDZ89082.1 serine protease [Microbulbifer marinus]
MKFWTRILVSAALCAVISCSQGKGSSGDSRSSESEATPTGFSITGTVTAAEFTAVDADTNDGGAPSSGNNDAESAQPLGNPSIAGGFVSAEGSGKAGQRFANGADREDWYRVSASAGQSINLHVHQFKQQSPAAVDLDLYLYSADDASNPVASSTGASASESISIPSTGDYLLRVVAQAGISNYTLKLDAGNNTAASPSVSQEFVPGELLIKWKSAPPAHWLQAAGLEPVRAAVANRVSAYRLTRADLAPIVADMEFLHLRASGALRHKLHTLAAVKKLQSAGLVEWVEPNYLYRSTLIPNDQHNHLQWHYRQVRLPQAWDITTGSADVIVAVLDTGVFSDHPDIRDKLVDGYDFISDATYAVDGDGIDSNPEDPGDKTLQNRSSWHGTHVSGTVGAATDNGTGVSGAGWKTRIMPLRVIGTSGGNSADVAQAVRYAAGLANDSGTVPARRADIINMSFGGAGRSQTLQTAIDDARAAGVIVVAAAGNDNSETQFYPAAMNGVIAVSATDYNRNKAPYSNFGSWVDLAAPGGNMGVDANGDGYGDGVISTHVNEGSGLAPAYSVLQGTSMASPHVAAVLALMKAVNRQLSPDDVDALLSQGKLTRDIGDAGRDKFFGMGLIDAFKAVEAASGPVTVPVLAAEPHSLNFGSTHATLEVDIKNIGADGARITGDAASAAKWIKAVEAVQTDTNGFGRYRISVSRAELADGAYSTDIRFPVEGSSDFALRANMKVGGSDNAGDAGYLYILLLKEGADGDGDGSAELQIVAQQAKAASEGSYSFHFTNVPAGEYLIAAGSDIDGDGFICGRGEACAMFPGRDFANPIALRTSLSGQDFVVDYDDDIDSGGQQLGPVQVLAPDPIRLRALP